MGSLVGQVLHTTAVGAEGAAGLRRGGGHVGDLQHADCRRDPRDRVAAVRIQVAFVYSAGDRQHAGDCGAYAVAGSGADVSVAAVDFGIPHALPFYLVLGPVCGIAAVCFSKALYWVEDTFEKLPVDELWWPAIGALGLGIIGFFVPRVLGVGYDTIRDILNGNLAWKLLLVVMLAKFAALVISLGSGTSGGLLAPTFMWSAAMGGLFAMIGNHVFPSAHLSPGAFALVAMGAVFGAASRATFSFIIFAFEITRDYNSVLPLMLVAVIADGVAMLFMPRSSIMTEKLARRGLHVHQDYEADVLAQSTVSETMEKNAPVILAGTKVGASCGADRAA